VYFKGEVPLKSVNFWIPLQKATVENGCMWYLPGSHLAGELRHHVLFQRPGGESDYTRGISMAMDHVEESKAVVCPVELGGATCHDPFNAHYAGPNTTDGWRRAWILHFAPYGKMRQRFHPKAVAETLRSIGNRKS